jgi:hypothetical protein
MSKQYYVREGRLFVKTDVTSVVDHRGEYYNADGSFSKERRDDSVGVCIMQNPTECIICGLNEYKNVTNNGVSCLLHNFPDWRLGEQEEMHIAIKFYKEQLNLTRGIRYHIHFGVSGGNAAHGAHGGLFCFSVNAVSSHTGADRGGQHPLRLFKTVKL